MAVTFVASSSASVASGSATIAPPAGVQAGDVMLMVKSSFREGSTPSGWTLVYAGYDAGFNIHFGIWRRTVVAGEPASYTVSQGSGNEMSVAIAAYRGADPTPSVVSSANFTDGNATAPTITTTAADSLVVNLLGRWSTSSGTITPNAALTSRVVTPSASQQAVAAIADEVYATPGTTTSRPSTNTSRSAGLAVALAPSGGTPAISGTLAATLPALTASLSGSLAVPPITGSLAATLPPLAASLSGMVPAGPISGSLTATLPALTASLAGTVAAAPAAPVETSTRYANDGYNYDGTAAVYFEPPIAEPPAHIRRAKVQQVHQSMSAPNLVNGVPR